VKRTEKVLEGRQTAVVGLVQQLTNDPKFEDFNPASINGPEGRLVLAAPLVD